MFYLVLAILFTFPFVHVLIICIWGVVYIVFGLHLSLRIRCKFPNEDLGYHYWMRDRKKIIWIHSGPTTRRNSTKSSMDIWMCMGCFIQSDISYLR
jgi:hypothetical protein